MIDMRLFYPSGSDPHLVEYVNEIFFFLLIHIKFNHKHDINLCVITLFFYEDLSRKQYMLLLQIILKFSQFTKRVVNALGQDR